MSNSQPNLFCPTLKFKKKPTLLGSLFLQVSLSTSLGLLGLSAYAQGNEVGQNENESCKPALIAQPQSITPQNDAEPQIQYLEATSLTQPSPNEYELLGGTIYRQPGVTILSDQIHYDKQTRQAVFEGHLEMHQPELIITGDKAKLDNNAKQAVVENTKFQLLPSRTHGTSKDIYLDEKANKVELSESMITTCPNDKKGELDWQLSFEKLQINNEKRRIIGNNTTLYLKGVPVFYTPYFDYPMDDRASGILFPEFGSYKSITSTTPEQYFKLPYYFNIAPNMDDTLSLLAMSERGLALDNEFRYIEKTNGVLHQANITLTGLHDRKVASDGLVSADPAGNLIYGDKDAQRWRAKINARQNWGEGWSSAINWHEVSDEYFFKDIPVEPILRNATLEERSARIDYRNGNFSGFARVLGYMRLQNAATNYEKRPEIALKYYTPIKLNSEDLFNSSSLNFDVLSHYADFYVPVSNHSRPEGKRFHLQPSLNYRFSNIYSKFNTSLVAHFTQYQMLDNEYNPSPEPTPSRFIPQFSTRGGLIFERSFQLLDKSYTQTLEPELQYLYTPYVDQSEFALFDTANRSLDFSNLFALNRFTGMDRIGDTSQITMALSSRILDEKGRRIIDAAIGQIAYLKDREVSLSGNTTDSDKFSDIFVKLGAHLNQWDLYSTLQYENQERVLTNASSRIRWKNKQDMVMLNHTLYNANTSYETNMLSVGAYSRVASNWDLGIYSSYNLDTEQLYETEIGLRYESCCWAAEIVAERTQLENGLYNDGVQVQFELKGLSTASSRFKNELTDKLDF